MQTARRVAENHIHAARLRRRDRIEHDRRRVRAFALPDDVGMGALRPDLELIGRRRAERIARAEQDLFARLMELICDLADRRRLADAVHTDDQHDRRLCGQIQRAVAHVQHVAQHLTQRLARLRHGLDPPVAHHKAQPLHGLDRRVHAEIGEDQPFFEVIIKIVVQLRRGEHAADRAGGLAQSLLYLFKKAHSLLLIYVVMPSCLVISSRSRLKIFDTPCSCIVTP